MAVLTAPCEPSRRSRYPWLVADLMVVAEAGYPNRAGEHGRLIPLSISDVALRRQISFGQEPICAVYASAITKADRT
jgi:hypothetical protein